VVVLQLTAVNAMSHDVSIYNVLYTLRLFFIDVQHTVCEVKWLYGEVCLCFTLVYSR